MRHDLRDAFRTIVRSPGYSIITIAVLALGIGSTSAIFSFVDGVLLRPLPYDEPDRIVWVWEKPPQGVRNSISTENFLDWQRDNDVFEAMAAVAGGGVTMSGGSEPVQIPGQRVSAGYFDVFGARAALGRTFGADEDQPGKDKVAVITYRLWQRQFAGDPTIVGKTVTFNSEPHTIIGVMAAASAFERGAQDVWRPLAFRPAEMTRNYHWLRSIARLKPGVTIDQARTRMDAIGARIAKDYPVSNKDWGVTIDRFADLAVNTSLRQSLTVLMWAVGALLLVGCANLANLALARGTAREREVIIRAALGAGRARLFKQFLLESLLLSFAGGALGLALGYAMMRGLKLLLPPFFLPREALVTIDWRALAFALGVSILTGLIFGTAPAFQAGRVDLSGSMKGSSRSVTADRMRRRLRDGLVVVEVALACALLVGAGLLMQSFLRLQQVEAAKDAATLVVAGLNAPDSRFPDADAARVFYRRILDRLVSVPGVVDVAVASAVPMQGWGYGMPLRVPTLKAGEAPAPGGAGFKMVSQSYFQTTGLPIIKGRAFSSSDTAASVPGTRRQSGLRHPLLPGSGADRPTRADRNDHPWAPTTRSRNVVGDHRRCRERTRRRLESARLGRGLLIVRAVAGLRSEPRRQGIASIGRHRGVAEGGDPRNRSESTAHQRPHSRGDQNGIGCVGPPAHLADCLVRIDRRTARRDRHLRRDLYSVAQRTHEIGVRAALGASRGRLMGLVMGRASVLTGLGLAAGLGTAIASGRLLEALLFGVTARDAISLASAATLLGAVAMVAAWIPARRAAAVDPLVALRVE